MKSHADDLKNVAPGTQLAFVVVLNSMFNLKQPGNYRLQVQRHEPASAGNESVSIHSGTASFTLSETLTAGEKAVNNAAALHEADVLRRATEATVSKRRGAITAPTPK